MIGEGTSFGNFIDIGDPDIGKDCEIHSFVFIPPGVHIADRVLI